MNQRKTILIAPLNWGLGHATRCIPIIRALKEDGYAVIIASDGIALELLQKEFSDLKSIALPSYGIEYAEKGAHFKRKMIASLPRMIKAIRAEKKALDSIIKQYSIDGIISDNRLGLYSLKVPSVFITHQLQVLSGKTTWLTTYVHNRFIKRFDECWIPDYKGNVNLSGKLGHPSKELPNVKYIGPLSRMKKMEATTKYDAIAILSGPEPQRTMLENILLSELKKYNGKVLLVQGQVHEEQHRKKKGTIEIVNYLTSSELEKAINSSAFVIARSGYTMVMDLAALGKKAFFIPTPGQTEQEYLAQRLKEMGIAPYVHQDHFRVKDLAKMTVYKGFEGKESKRLELRQFFSLFEGKRKLRSYSKFAFDIDLFLMRFNNVFYNRET